MGIDVNDVLIEEYLNQILDANKRINVTRITDVKQARLLHIEDSLSVLEELDAAPEGLYGDLGSGGGFPGVPLAIISGRETYLIDSVKKKMAAVKEIIDALGLDEQIHTYDGRIEELVVEMPCSFSALTARALSSLPSLLELASPLLLQGGRLICLKAHVEEDEKNQAFGIETLTGMKFILEREYYLSDDKTFRTVMVFEKVSEPEISLPRKIGLAQKRPLKG